MDCPTRRVHHCVCVLLWCLCNFLLVETCDGFLVARKSRETRSILHSSGTLRRHLSTSAEITVDSLLLDRLSRNDTSSLALEGYVLTKRKLGKGLIFVDFQLADYPDICQAMLRQEYAQQDLGLINNLLLRGTYLKITGRAAPTRNPGNVVFLIQSVEFRDFPRQLQYIQMILQHYQKGFIPSDQLLRAVNSSKVQSKLLHLQQSVEDEQFLKEVSRDVFQSLRDDPNYPVAAIQSEYTRPGRYSISKAPPHWQSVPDVVLNNREASDKTTEDIPFLSVEQALDPQRVSRHVDGTSTTTISIMGWVQNRRRFDHNITMLALVEDYSSLVGQDTSDLDMEYSGPRLLSILHPDLVSPREDAGLFRNLAAVGSLVKLEGRLVASQHRDKNNDDDDDDDDQQKEQLQQEKQSATVVLWIESIRLEQSSSRPGAIRHVLDLVVEGKLDRQVACHALRITTSEEAESLTVMDATQRQWKANQLVTRLQEASANTTAASKSPNSPTTQLFYSKNLEVLAKYQHLLDSHPIHVTTLQDMEQLLTQVSEETTTTTTRPIPEDRQQPAKNPPTGSMVQRTVLPVGIPGSRWQRKKRPQLAWMGERIKQVLQSHPEYGQRPLEILDIGGGKGSLANYLGRTMQDQVRVHVVDICEGAVANGASRAKRWNLPIEFSLADASQHLNLTADVVVALHACGHLSDVALAHAMQRQAGFVIVPCCFHSNSHLQVPLIDTRTGTIGTEPKKVQWTVPEWLGVPTQDWEALTLLAEVQSDLTLASQATAVICALRARAVANFVVEQEEQQPTIPDRGNTERIISIQRFPIEFSTRNTVLVGQCRR